MSVPLQFRTAMEAQWTAKGYDSTPLVYGFREARRTKDIDAVVLGHGRIVYHPGTWPGPEADAGQMSNEHAHAFRTGRNYGSDAMVWTVHCHGFDPAYPDATAENAECAHDDICYALREMFFSVVKYVQLTGPWKNLEYRAAKWVRDPEERRFGELLRCEFAFTVGMREAPILPIQYPEVKPSGAVIGASGNENIIVEVP
jgi:hypothetical protein